MRRTVRLFPVTHLICTACQSTRQLPTNECIGGFFIPVRHDENIDSRWPSGVVAPTWFDEKKVATAESNTSKDPVNVLDVVVLGWPSQVELDETLRLYDVQLTKHGNQEVEDRTFNGLSNYKLKTVLHAPRLVSNFEAMNWCSITLTGGREDYMPVQSQGLVVFANPAEPKSDRTRIRSSVQGTCRTMDVPPKGFRLPCWTVENDEEMSHDRWYVKLAQTEDPRFPIAVAMRTRVMERQRTVRSDMYETSPAGFLNNFERGCRF